MVNIQGMSSSVTIYSPPGFFFSFWQNCVNLNSVSVSKNITGVQTPIQTYLYNLYGSYIKGLCALLAAIHQQKKVLFPENVQYHD